jgi:hypothetical protein
MKGGRAGVLVFFCLAAATLCAQSELWDRAAALADLGKDLLPGTMQSVMEELNDDGSVKSDRELVLRYSYDARGKAQATEVVRATQDGRDVTEKTRADMRKQGSAAAGNAGMFGFNGVLFGADARKKTRLLPGASWAERGGRRTGLVPFEITMEGKGMMTGTAEIDAESGIPSLIRTTARFPFVKELSFTMAYAEFPARGFALTQMELAGAMSFLGITRLFHARMQFGDYRWYGPTAADGSAVLSC